MSEETQSPQEQFKANLNELADLGVSKLDAAAKKAVAFAPSLAPLVTSLVVSLASAGLSALIKEIKKEPVVPQIEG